MEGKKTKEKTRELAHSRRQRENDTFVDIAETLPILESAKDLDKASILRVAIHYLKLRDLLQEGGDAKPAADGDDALDDTVDFPGPESPISISSLLPNFSRDALQALDGFMLVISRDGRILYTSESISSYLGLRQVDVIGVHVQDIIHPQDLSEVSMIFQMQGRDVEQVFDSKDPLRRKFIVRMRCAFTPSTRSITRCSNFKPVHYSAFLKFARSGANQGQFLGVVALCRLANIARIRELCVGTYFKTKHNLDLSYQSVDTRIRWILGYDPAEMVGLKAYEYFHPEDLSATSSCHMNLLTNGMSHSPCYRFQSHWGDWVWVRSKSHVVYNPISQLPEGLLIFTWIVRIDEEDERMVAVKDGKSATAVKKYSNLASTISVGGGSLDISKLADPNYKAADASPSFEQAKPVPQPAKPVSTPPILPSPPHPSATIASKPVPPQPYPAAQPAIPVQPVSSSTTVPIPISTHNHSGGRYPPNMNPFDPFSPSVTPPDCSPQHHMPPFTNDNPYTHPSTFIPSPPYTPYSGSPPEPLPLDQLPTHQPDNLSPCSYPTPYDSAQSSPDNAQWTHSPTGSSGSTPVTVSPYTSIPSAPTQQAFEDEEVFDIASEATQFTSDIVDAEATVITAGPDFQFTCGPAFAMTEQMQLTSTPTLFTASVAMPSYAVPQHVYQVHSGYVNQVRARYTRVAGGGVEGGRGRWVGPDRENIRQLSQWLKSEENLHIR